MGYGQYSAIGEFLTNRLLDERVRTENTITAEGEWLMSVRLS